MNKIKVSIIVPVYNVSSDSSSKICDEYLKKDERIVVIHKKNEGVSVARNVGINTAKGKYILFCDSDDYVEKDWCETLYKLQIDNIFIPKNCKVNNIESTNLKCKISDHKPIIVEVTI